MAKREKSEAAEKIEKAAKEKKAGAPKAKKGNIFKRIGKWFAKFGKDFKGETKKITWRKNGSQKHTGRYRCYCRYRYCSVLYRLGTFFGYKRYQRRCRQVPGEQNIHFAGCRREFDNRRFF